MWCCWLLLTAGWADPQPQSLDVAADGVVLRAQVGDVPEYVLPFDLGDVVESATVTIPWRTSAMVDLHASTLSLLVNGVPLQTQRLEHLVQNGTPLPWEVSLPPKITGGELTVRARLAIEDDPCLVEFPEEAWLVLYDGELTWVGNPLEDEEARPIRPVQLPGAIADRTVRVNLDRVPEDPEWATAALHVWRMLRGYGALPTLDERADIVVDLRHAHLHDARATAEYRGTTLRIVGHGADDLSDLALAMSDRGFLERCQAWPCRMGPGQPESEPPDERDPDLAWSLVDAGYFDGVHASGPMEIDVRAVPPQHWVRSEAPRVRLAFRRSGNLEPDDSRLEVLYNGVPFASVDLSDAIPGMLHVVESPLPRNAWNELGWSLSMRMHPVSRDAGDCQRNTPAWITLDPSTGVIVPHHSLIDDGIAGFADRMRSEAHPTISWPPHPTAEELASAATVLDAFESAAVWTPVAREDCLEGCVRVRRDGPQEIALANYAWADAAFGKVPMVDAMDRPLIHSNGEWLDVHVVPGSAKPSQSPIPHLLPGPWALFGRDGWSGFGAEDLPGVLSNDDPAVAEISSAEIEQRTMFDLLFGVLVVAVLMGGAGWVWRSSDAGEQEDFGLEA